MNQNLFQSIPLIKKSFFQNIFGQNPEENAVIELNNILATKEINEISESEISEIENRYNIDLTKEFSLNLEEFYATYLNICLRDNIAYTESQKNLKHLKEILKLSDDATDNIYKKIGEIIYKEAYDKAISNGNLTNEKENELKKIEIDLKLTEETTTQISSLSRHNYIESLLKKIIADDKISPDEWSEFTEASKNLKIDLKIDESNKVQIERMKLNWQIQNGELPILQVAINLQKGENCYYTNTVEWFEHRSVTKRINYQGPRARIKIMRGIYYSAGSMAVNRVTSDEIKLIDRGTIYLTNKRIIFMGNGKNSNIRLDKILSITPYSDAVELEKDTGKSPTLRMNSGADIFAMMISRLINEH